MKKFATRAIHAGSEPDPTTGAVMPPIYQTSTYAQKSPGNHKGYEYSRMRNPTRHALQTALADLENGKWAYCYASGMAAIDAVLKLLRPGDEVLASLDLYGGTFRMMKLIFEPYGIIFKFIDLKTPGLFEKSITPATRMVWMESPSNPLLRITDIAAVTQIAGKKGIISVVDSTFASPYLCNPLDLGADIVMHSVTKYLGGHSDVIMGALIGKDENLGRQLEFQQKATGAVPGPQDCFLVLRGLKTLHLRMRRHCENAMAVAEWLSGHKKVGTVYYPGLPTHPEHELAGKQMRGFGGMVSFDVRKEAGADAIGTMEKLQLITVGESLGGVESLCAYPPKMSHATFSPEERENMGIRNTLIRLSIGVEDVDDIITDLDQALGG
ncbi:cystathionine gamma-synthase [Ravibacter arvi]|uniref:Cystathionine gamma-synthase n=1 Tax=Ravibacter arvi TaxID=2051041 RepID=A0ABP8LWI5_9BACT